MRERLFFLSNTLLFLVAGLALASLQTSLWFQIFGYFPGPALWVPVLIYAALFRTTLEVVVFAYLLGFVLSSMTVMPQGMLMVTCLALALSAQLFKRRIYWEGSSYTMLICGLGALLFNVYHWLASLALGNHPLTNPAIMDWLIEALLTPLVAPPLFPLFAWFDRLTNREPSSEANSTSQVP